MRMSVVVVADGRNVTRPVGIDCWFIVNVIVAVLVAVMPEMCSVVRCMFKCIANTHRCSVSSVQ